MQRIKGFMAVITSALIFGTMPLMAKTVYAEGGNSITLTFLRFAIPIPILAIFLTYIKGMDISLSKTEVRQLMFLGPIGYGLTALTLYMSYDYISSGIATTLHFGYPVIVILAYVILFREKTSFVKLISVSLTVIGILLLNDSNADLDIRGVVLALTSAVTFAFYIVFLDRSGLKRIYPLILTMYLSISAGTLIFLFGMATGTLDFTMSTKGWVVASILSLSVAILGISMFQVGVALVGPQTTSILSTFEPMTGIIIGVVVFNEIITLRTGLGLAAILTAVVLVTAFDRG